MKTFAFKSVVAAALVLPFSVFSQTTTFTFDPTGTAGATGDITGLGAIDQSPGNALAVGAVGASVGSTTTLLYQANLGTLNNSLGNPVFLDGTGNNYFTFVAGFRETLASLSTVGGTSTATFALSAQQPNFFYMYRTAAPGDNLTGLGFTSGTRILEGTLNQANFSSNFSTAPGAPVTFDQFGANNYPGVTSLAGTGGSRFNATITSFDPLYFPSFSGSGVTLSFFNTSQVAPFQQVDPSAAFSSNGIANGDVVANRGAINGVSGPSFQFQADANMSFQVSAVPEPESYALMLAGLGLIGFVVQRRARV